MRCLLYVDPSPRGEWALALAELLRPLGLRLTLVATEEDVRASPDILSRAVARLGGAVAGEALRPGPAERAVLAEAQGTAYDLLIVPPAGRNAIQRMVRGSRVAAVVHSARAPVLVARRPPPRLERILAAIGGTHAHAVAAAAAALARRTGSLARYLHVSDEVALPYGSAETPGPPPVEASRAAVLAADAAAELVTREGLVVEEVLEDFEAGAHQLLVLGASGAHALGEEDIAERLLLKCPGSTLIVPATGFPIAPV